MGQRQRGLPLGRAVARELATEIRANGRRDGELLGTKAQLVGRFGVATATINEAVRILSAQGLIDPRPGPGGGIYVAKPRRGARKRSGLDVRFAPISRAEAVARHLKAEIARHELQPGDHLGTKASLKGRFGVANATINEAIRLMEMTGLIRARPGPGGGIFVATRRPARGRPSGARDPHIRS